MTYFQDAKTSLEQVAATYAETIINSIQQEYPNQMQHMMTDPKDRPTPREAHPAFYGCFDWHSSVEMHWALIRLLRLTPNAFDKTKAMEVLGAHLTQAALFQEAEYLRSRPQVTRERSMGYLKPEHQERVADAYHAFKDVDGFAKVASLADIRANDGNLSIPLYVRTQAVKEPAGDYAVSSLKQAVADWQTSSDELNSSIGLLLQTLE